MCASRRSTPSPSTSAAGGRWVASPDERTCAMRRPLRRSVTIRKKSDTAGITLRCGGTDLGVISGLSGDQASGMSGQLAHTPAFADHAARFLAQAAAEQAGADGQAEVERLAAENERLGVHVHHAVHDMRIDAAGTLRIAAGQAR